VALIRENFTPATWRYSIGWREFHYPSRPLTRCHVSPYHFLPPTHAISSLSRTLSSFLLFLLLSSTRLHLLPLFPFIPRTAARIFSFPSLSSSSRLTGTHAHIAGPEEESVDPWRLERTRGVLMSPWRRSDHWRSDFRWSSFVKLVETRERGGSTEKNKEDPILQRFSVGHPGGLFR
jgi:hypothetical protein